jgi:hypothetical protein
LALEGAARQASSTSSARLRERADDVISYGEIRDFGTDRCNDARDVVSEHCWFWHDIVSRE